MQREYGQKRRPCEVIGRNWRYVSIKQGISRTVSNHHKVGEMRGMDSTSKTLVGTNHDDSLISGF